MPLSHRPALVPEENPRAGEQHGAAYQGDQPGLLELGDEARLVVLVEPGYKKSHNLFENNFEHI